MTRVAVGIGARPGVRTDAVRALLERVLAEHDLDPADAVFATIAARAGEPGLRAAVRAVAGGRIARSDPAALITWSAVDLAAEPVPHPSARVAAAVRTPAVAEAAALRTARTFPGATAVELVVPKTVGDGVTVAVARPAAVERS